ncbi:MAG: phosphoglycerate mutase, partial [Candidatus Berkelbacteria bacterium Licking1014_85]
LAVYLSSNNFNQFHIAETEKYAHVTYFFNGLNETQLMGEDRLMVPSIKTTTYRNHPEMSAETIRNELIKAIDSQKYHFLLANFANCDMVGHCGDLESARVAVETVDTQLAYVLDSAIKNYHTVIVTADHGNIEQMLDPKTGEIDTAHTKNPVPFIIVDSDFSKKISLHSGSLCDISPTILKIMGLKIPDEMLGKSLF